MATLFTDIPPPSHPLPLYTGPLTVDTAPPAYRPPLRWDSRRSSSSTSSLTATTSNLSTSSNSSSSSSNNTLSASPPTTIPLKDTTPLSQRLRHLLRRLASSTPEIRSISTSRPPRRSSAVYHIMWPVGYGCVEMSPSIRTLAKAHFLAGPRGAAWATSSTPGSVKVAPSSSSSAGISDAARARRDAHRRASNPSVSDQDSNPSSSSNSSTAEPPGYSSDSSSARSSPEPAPHCSGAAPGVWLRVQPEDPDYPLVVLVGEQELSGARGGQFVVDARLFATLEGTVSGLLAQSRMRVAGLEERLGRLMAQINRAAKADAGGGREQLLRAAKIQAGVAVAAVDGEGSGNEGQQGSATARVTQSDGLVARLNADRARLEASIEAEVEAQLRLRGEFQELCVMYGAGERWAEAVAARSRRA